MSNKLGILATIGLVSATAASITFTTRAYATPEDQPGWSCVDDGNRVCGPGNPEKKPAGCYDDGGVMVAAWPCYVTIDPKTGDSDVFTPDERLIPTSVY